MNAGTPVSLDCPPWCVTEHAKDAEVRCDSDALCIPLSRYPFMAGQDLCHTATITALTQEPHESEPLVVVVVPDDGRLVGETEVKLTVDEVEQFADHLLELVRAARRHDGVADEHDDARDAFYCGYLAGTHDGLQGGRASEHWASYAKWKAEQ